MRWRAIFRDLITCLVAALLAAGCSRPVPQVREDPEESSPGRIAEAMPATPAYPRTEQLLRVDLDLGRGAFDYFVDPASIALEPGGIRYTLVARSAQGASNVSFEALQCRSWQRRIYALGRADGTWVPSRKSEWLPLDIGPASRPHVALAVYYFCPGRLHLDSVEEAVRALRFGGHPRARQPQS